MLANLLNVAGVNHVVTVDLHASQMQGFFRCPVDNLHAEPLIARWIKHNVANWQEGVCVSKNAGGTKRVTSLADALKLNFGMVTTDKRRGGGYNMTASMIMRHLDGYTPNPKQDADADADVSKLQISTEDYAMRPPSKSDATRINTESADKPEQVRRNGTSPPRPSHTRQDSSQSSPRKNQVPPSPLRTANPASTRSPLIQAQSSTETSSPIQEEDEFTDEKARDITQGRLVQGHIVPDDYPSPTQSAMSSSMIFERPEEEDPMTMSHNSSFFNPDSHPLGGTADAAASSDEEEESFNNPSLEQMITLVGDVRNRPVFIVDDMIDKAGSWIAAAECVVKRGGAKKVYCVATHGLFGGDALAELEACGCIDMIIVTNSFPIPAEKTRGVKKLVVLDLATLLAEAIRRNHYGESISPLFSHTYD